MTLLTCAAVRRRLPAFHDRELPVGDLIAIEGHLHDCPPCNRDLKEMQDVGHALRLAAAPAPSDDWRGVRSSVISRMRAEAHESWPAKVRRAFDDLHLVWVALASTAATASVERSVSPASGAAESTIREIAAAHGDSKELPSMEN